MARVVARSLYEFQKAMANSNKNLKSNEDARSFADKQAAFNEPNDPNYRARVYEIVRRIPAGRVMTYGQLAEILGEGYTPRTVGFVMHAASQEKIPWQRVINSQGACSTGRVILPPDKQQRLLEAEGITFDARGRCELNRYRWTPDETNASAERERNQAQANLFGE